MPEAAEEVERGEGKHFALPFIFRVAAFVGRELWAAKRGFFPFIIQFSEQDFKLWMLPMCVTVNGTHWDTLMFYV